MANQAPPVQGYMLELAATRLTPEKLALLNYKLATGSPTAAQITDGIKPGEWEAVVGDTREFNDIRMRLEAAIDAWVNSNPTSKGFVWPPQAIKLNLTDAAAKLSKLTTDSTSPVSIIRAGAEGKIPVHWFNDLKRTTYISDFTGDLSGTDYDGPLQLTHTSLRELAVAESITVMDFQFTDQDFALLEKIKGTAVDDDGNLLGYRHPATKDGTVTVSRDQLFVYGHDLNAYAADLAPVTVSAAPGQDPATASQVSDQNALPDPERRLTRLMALGGSKKYKNSEWRFTKINELVAIEKNEGRKRTDPHTIRKDLREAAQTELDAKKEGQIAAQYSKLGN